MKTDCLDYALLIRGLSNISKYLGIYGFHYAPNGVIHRRLCNIIINH